MTLSALTLVPASRTRLSASGESSNRSRSSVRHAGPFVTIALSACSGRACGVRVGSIGWRPLAWCPSKRQVDAGLRARVRLTRLGL